MPGLDFDEPEERMFQHAASQYGVVVCGGSAEDREAALRAQLEGPFAVVDGREIDSVDGFVEAVILAAADVSVEDLEDRALSRVDVERALSQSEVGLLVLEFDSMGSEGQSGVAQLVKGVAESSLFEGVIGFSAEECDAVVRAEFDLSGRIRSWTVE